MISKFRIRFDFIGQVVLIVGVFLFALFEQKITWTNTFLIVLAIWQVISALHLLMAYQYVKKVNFLKTMAVLILSLPVWIHLVGHWAYLPVGGVLVWYFIQTAKDLRIINKRPRSFWDL